MTPEWLAEYDDCIGRAVYALFEDYGSLPVNSYSTALLDVYVKTELDAWSRRRTAELRASIGVPLIAGAGQTGKTLTTSGWSAPRDEDRQS